jgi:hypothetical protein
MAQAARTTDPAAVRMPPSPTRYAAVTAEPGAVSAANADDRVLKAAWAIVSGQTLSVLKRR